MHSSYNTCVSHTKSNILHVSCLARVLIRFTVSFMRCVYFYIRDVPWDGSWEKEECLLWSHSDYSSKNRSRATYADHTPRLFGTCITIDIARGLFTYEQ